MKPSDLESPYRTSRIPSISSSKMKLGAFGRARKIGCERNVASMLLQQRQALRVVYENVDVTPKPLFHTAFGVIDENQITALENTGLFQMESASQLMASPSRISGLGASSSILFRSFSMSSDDLQMESLLSTQIYESLPVDEDEDVAPSPFFLPR